MCSQLRPFKRVRNSFCTKSEMDFLLCCSEAISDFVSGSETNKVVGFIGTEGGGLDAESLEEFIDVHFM